MKLPLFFKFTPIYWQLLLTLVVILYLLYVSLSAICSINSVRVEMLLVQVSYCYWFTNKINSWSAGV